VVEIFNKLDKSIVPEIASDAAHNTGSWGVKFVAPNGKSLDIPFKKDISGEKHAPGFISRRMHFDNFLVEQLEPEFATLWQNAALETLNYVENGVELTIRKDGEEIKVFTQLVIAADGDRSIVSRQLAGHKMDPLHYCAGIRAYYSGVTDLHPQNYIELHFLDELLPGYFWIFPLPGGYCNVGAGMLSKSVSNKKVNLRQSMLKAINENPGIKHRFAGAKLEGSIQGWGLPLGSKKRQLSGDRFMLTGDAASIIDPFTGEGIGNAMYCGMTAAKYAAEAIRSNNFSAAFLDAYTREVYRRLGKELRLSHTLQKLCNYPFLFNFVVNKAGKNKTLRDTISCMFEDVDLRSEFRKPSFYFRLLFNV
jgi:flavin-dependent dehydrogenase